MTAFQAAAPTSPAAFLARADSFLRAREDHHNLLMSLVASRGDRERWPDGECFGVVEHQGEVVACFARTPPYKLLITEMPLPAAAPVAALLAERYEEIPAVFGPRPAAEAVAAAWASIRGGSYRPGMPQGLYRLDRVTPVPGVTGSMRRAGGDDVERMVRWGQGFQRDTGIPFPPGEGPIRRWIAQRVLHVWQVGADPVSVAVAHGRTERGVRIGYVYTPPEHRGQGFASGLVAALSQAMLDEGSSFCVLYTDLTNPTSNALYQRLGYRLIAELLDVDLVPELP